MLPYWWVDCIWAYAVWARRDIVAFVKWQYPYALSEDEQMENERWEKEHEDPMPEGYNAKLFDEFFAAILRNYRRFVEPTGDFGEHFVCHFVCFIADDPAITAVVHILAVSPRHQRRGLGSLLLRDGLTLSDRDCARTYIESSPVALALYLRHGWKQVGDILIDIEKYGGEGTASERCLMREPGGSSRR